MSDKPRTTTVDVQQFAPGPRLVHAVPQIKVIELEPVLDQMYEYVYGGTGRWLEPDVEWMIDLLREHGRLK